MSLRIPRILVVIVLAGVTLSRAQAAPETPTQSVFDGGGDIRLRYEAFDKIPVAYDPPGVARVPRRGQGVASRRSSRG